MGLDVEMGDALWGWIFAVVLALLLLRATVWYARQQAARRRYVRGVNTLYASFRAETDVHAIARGKVRVLWTDANHLLTRAHKGQRYSRRVMARYGVSQRRWNSAFRLLHDIDALPLGLCSRAQAYQRLRERTRQLYDAASVVDVMPFD